MYFIDRKKVGYLIFSYTYFSSSIFLSPILIYNDTKSVRERKRDEKREREGEREREKWVI